MPTELTISVNAQGGLTFSPGNPDDDWIYQNGETLRFRCADGPFVIQFIPMTANLPQSPFGADFCVSSDTPQDGFYFADVAIKDGLTPEQRANMANSQPNGFLQRYKYIVTVGHRGIKCGSHT